MKLKFFFANFLVLTGITILFGATDTYNQNAERLLEKGRQLFYASVDDETKLDSAFALFEQLGSEYPFYEGRAQTYIGVLTALKGKHAFWVYSKYKLVKKGLEIMDKGIRQSPNDVEALFVYGSTCHFMPFLFGRNDEAQQAFHKIMELLPSEMHNYDPGLVKNVIDFLIEYTELNTSEVDKLDSLKTQLQVK